MKFAGIAWILVFSGLAIAQEEISPNVAALDKEWDYDNLAKKPAEVPKNDSASNNQLMFQYRMAKEKQRFHTMLLVSGTLILSLLIILFFITRHDAYTAGHIVMASGLPFIIFGVIFLMLLVDTAEQLTAGIGILGAVAGYLFRSMQGEAPTKTSVS